MTDRAELLYGYAVLAPRPTTSSPVLPASGDSPAVDMVSGSLVSLAVSRVPEDEFGQERVEASMDDEAWLSRLALAHFDVVGRLFERGPVLPLRLCTVFRSADRARAALDANGAELGTALTKVTGAAQWSVRVTAKAASRRSSVEADSGTGYLEGLARAKREAGAAQAADQRRVADLAHRLARLAVAVDMATGMEPAEVHAADYLVRDGDARTFIDTAHGFGQEAARGLAVDVRGPWPPYSFVPALPDTS